MPNMTAMPAIPPAVLAQMPSAQRARIEAALKARRGDNGRYVPKVCVTAASLRKSPALGLRREADCKRTRNVRTPHGWQFQQVLPPQRPQADYGHPLQSGEPGDPSRALSTSPCTKARTMSP